MIALERAGVPVNTYYASEIDPIALSISKRNYPNIIQLGDVANWRKWDINLGGCRPTYWRFSVPGVFFEW